MRDRTEQDNECLPTWVPTVDAMQQQLATPDSASQTKAASPLVQGASGFPGYLAEGEMGLRNLPALRGQYLPLPSSPPIKQRARQTGGAIRSTSEAPLTKSGLLCCTIL